jgi:hypothetical protein
MRLLWPSMFIRFLFQKNNDNAYNFCKQRSHISTLLIFSFISLSAGLLEFKYALDLTRYLKNEMNYIPWDAGYSSISSLTHILPKSGDIYKDLRVSFQHNFLVISKQVLLLFSNWLRTIFQCRKRSFTKITNISCIEISIWIDKTKFQKTWFSWQWHPLRQVIKIRLFNLDQESYTWLPFGRDACNNNVVFVLRYLRVDAVYAACGVGDEVCLAKTKDLFGNWIENDSLWVHSSVYNDSYLWLECSRLDSMEYLLLRPEQFRHSFICSI